MKQTAIEQLIEKIDFCILYYQNEIALNYHAQTIVEIMQGKISELQSVKDMTNRMLPIEKHQIIDAWQSGNDAEPKEETLSFAEHYYNQTYKK